MDSRVGLEGIEARSASLRGGYCARTPGPPPAPRSPLVSAPAAFLGGAVAAAALGPTLAAPLVAVVVLGWCCVPSRRGALLAATLGAALVGGAIAVADGRRLHGDEQLDVVLVGRIAPPLLGAAGEGARRFDLLVDRCEPACDLRRVRLASYTPLAAATGERWRVGVRLRAPRSFANPGRGDPELRLWRQGIDAEGYLRGADAAVRLALAPPAGAVARLRAGLAARVRAAAPVGGGLLCALLLGDRAAMDAAHWRRLAATGTTHLFVVSGLHVALVAGVVLLALRLAGIGSTDPRAACVALAAATAFGILAGFGIPVRRALAMLALALFARARGRHVQGGSLLLRAAALLVLVEPLAVLDLGFWLSCLAVAALVVGTPAREPGPVAWLRRWFAPQFAVALVLAVPLLAAFGWVPLLGPAVNLLLVPLVGLFVLPAGLLALALLSVLPEASAALLAVLGASLEALLSGLGSHAPALTLRAPGVLAGAAALSLALLALADAPRRLRIAAALLAVAALWSPVAVPPQGEYEVHVLDVGQGLAVLVRTHEHALLFDTGGRFGDGLDAGGLVVAPALRALGVGRLDRVLVSHADSDHAGGLPGLLSAMPVAVVLGPTQLPGVDGPCHAPLHWHWDGVRFEVLHPSAGARPMNRNRGSCVLRIASASGRVAILPGDVDRHVERRIAPRAAAATLMIAPHHGSRTSSGRAWVRVTRPRFVIFAAGVPNAFGHPHGEVVARWRRAGACPLTTGRTGMLSWSSARPERITLWREGGRRWWRWRGDAARGECRARG